MANVQYAAEAMQHELLQTSRAGGLKAPRLSFPRHTNEQRKTELRRSTRAKFAAYVVSGGSRVKVQAHVAPGAFPDTLR
jgi:hypothetical protein